MSRLRKAFWVVLKPISVATGLPVEMRFCSANNSRATGALGVTPTTYPYLMTEPDLEINVFDGEFNGSSSMTIQNLELSNTDNFAATFNNYVWDGTEATVYEGLSNASVIGDLTAYFTGTLEKSPLVTAESIKFTIQDKSYLLDTSIFNTNYLGTGGMEGTAEMEGTPKPFAMGYPLNVAPVLVDPAYLIYQYHGYGTAGGVVGLYENGLGFGAASAIIPFTTNNATTFANLRAATVAAGQWVDCPSLGMFRLGGEPVSGGAITADVAGHSSGGVIGYFNDVITYLIGAANLSSIVDGSSFTGFMAAIYNQVISDYYEESINLKSVIEYYMSQVGGYYFFNSAGKIRFGLVRFSTPSFTLRTDGTTSPVVEDGIVLSTSAPYKRVKMGADKVFKVHQLNEISDALYQTVFALNAELADLSTDFYLAASDGNLTIDEKIRITGPTNSRLVTEYTNLTARATALGLTYATLTTAYNNYVSLRDAISPAWNNTAVDSIGINPSFRTSVVTLANELILLNKRISEEDAKRADWATTSGRPPLLTGPSLTVDETFKDPSVWGVSNFTFLTDSNGEGYIQQSGTATGVITHKPETAVPIDPNAMYEASWDLYQDGAGVGTGIFYTIVQLYDAAGINISGDGSYWMYQTAAIPVTTRGVREIHSARFGRGTDRPFPSNAVKFSLGVISNYTNLNITTQVRRVFARQISTLEMTSNHLHRWALGDGKAVRHLGVVGWGQSTAYSRSSIRGPQRFSFRFVGPNSSGTAKMAGLTESSSPTSYTDGTLSVYYSDTANQIEIWSGGSQVAVYSGITTRQADEFTVEYDGLYLRPLRNGARMGYELLVGPDKTYRSYVDSYYINQGVTQIDHKSTLSSAVIGGNVVDINGNPVPLDALRNNMIDVGWWKKGATIPWASTGGSGAARSIISTPVDVAIESLKSSPEDNMLVTKTGASGSTIGGGWNDGAATRITGIDPDKTYRFVLPVRHVAGDTSLYWGVDGNSVCTINTTTLDGNPYFVSAGAGILQTDRWYVFVGFIYPRNSTGKNNDSAGIYDCRTGKRIVSGANYCFKPSFTEVRHRAFQYYGAVDSTSVFNKPVVNVVDGTEPELSTFFEQTSSLEDVSLDWTMTSGHIARGNSISKMVGAASGWDGKAITKQTYKSNAFISGRLETDGFIGLHELGNSNVSYTSMEHSVHRSGDGNWYYWSGAAAVLNMGTSRNGVTFGNLTDWALFYDNATLKIFADGVSMHEVTATPDRSYQGCVALYSTTHLVSNVRFGPFTENTQVVVTPLGDFDIAADYLGVILSTQFNIVFTPIVKRGGADFRTNNRMTYEIVNRTGGFTTTGYVDINNTTGSADKGRITITNCSASGSFTVNVKYDNVVISSFVMKGTVRPAPAPTGGGGGGGTKSGSFSVAGLTASGTAFVEKGRISGLVKAAGETIRCYLSAAEYTLAHTSTITRNMVAKWQYSVAGAESWTDVGTAVNGSSVTYIAEDFASDTGSITVNQNVAPSNNTYDLRLVVAVNTTGGTLTFGLGINATVAIGV